MTYSWISGQEGKFYGARAPPNGLSSTFNRAPVAVGSSVSENRNVRRKTFYVRCLISFTISWGSGRSDLETN